MTSIVGASSQTAFLSLRARLRTPECSSPSFAGRVAKPSQLDGSKTQEHLERELMKILDPYRDKAKKKDGASVGENYILLEQLAHSLAVTGAGLHEQSINEIKNSDTIIQAKIDELATDSSNTLAKSAALYELIQQPLVELSAACDPDEPEDTVIDQVADLYEEFSNAEERLDLLHEEWQACLRAEQDAWRRLLEDENEPRQELNPQVFLDAVEEIMASGEAEINNIEEEYAEYIQIESLKVMQTLMEG
ncbi:hypothetical protein NLG97_g602 [Lecanicillium saksenae]|uniref:Uncharacterized protein n=1 Tax=Lecanicillium saksenae TaxID=468837 RepID=A0ACC1R633_9HYPO|nr:hypothetical protein NLG97_g602 [Lecanicillium saksenae]